MIAIAESLDKHTEAWEPEVTSMVAELIGEITELADADALGMLSSHSVTDCLSPWSWSLLDLGFLFEG